MGKPRVVTLLMAVVWLVGLAGITAGDSTGTMERGWWTEGWQPSVTQQKAAVKPNPAAVAAKARLDSASAKRWHVGWNEVSGLPTGVSGESKQYAGSPTEIAGQFIQGYRPLFTGMANENDPGDIVYVLDTAWYDADPTRPATIVMYKETYRGVPVHLGGAPIHVNPQGRVIWAGGTPYRIDSLDVTPTLTPEGAVAAIRTLITPDTVRSVAYVRLSVEPSQPPRLVYVIWAEVRTDPFTDPFTFLVDAKSGDVLSVQMMSEDDPGPVVPPSKPKMLPDSLL
jgi:hypothetical protein